MVLLTLVSHKDGVKKESNLAFNLGTLYALFMLADSQRCSLPDFVS
jgi:hypothetical protein